MPDGSDIALERFIEAPQVGSEMLTGTLWRFGALGGETFAPFLVLAPDGRLGPYSHPNEDGWQVVDGSLEFVTRSGIVSTRFDRAFIEDGSIAALAGRVLIDEREHYHQLRLVEHPAVRERDQAAERRATFLRGSRRRRPNLVVLRAGETSLHGEWTRDILDHERNWDLCLSYYGSDPGSLSEPFEWLTHQPAQRKFEAIFDLFSPDSRLWDYERVWLPDDDLLTSWGDINRMFHLSRKYGLQLSQPSLAQVEGCHILHKIVAQKPDNVLRFTTFVEVMCPIFSREALRCCIGTFQDSLTGFGLDRIWPSMLGLPATTIGVIDDVGMIHTRPFAQNYDLASAIAEEAMLHRAYQFTMPPTFFEIGAVRR
jgi:hypothetical protein